MLPNVVLFEGLDSSGHSGLWETDGTTAGTFEITGIAATFSTGLYPANLTPLNANEVVFNGTNKSGLAGLWVTDGTAAGTHELTGIAGVAKTGGGIISVRSHGLQWKSAVQWRGRKRRDRPLGDRRNGRRDARTERRWGVDEASRRGVAGRIKPVQPHGLQWRSVLRGRQHERRSWTPLSTRDLTPRRATARDCATVALTLGTWGFVRGRRMAASRAPALQAAARRPRKTSLFTL